MGNYLNLLPMKAASATTDAMGQAQSTLTVGTNTGAPENFVYWTKNPTAAFPNWTLQNSGFAAFIQGTADAIRPKEASAAGQAKQ